VIIDTCAVILLTLVVVSMVMQLVRAKKREKIVRSVDQSTLRERDREKWDDVEESFDPFFKGFRKIQLVKKNMSRLPDGLKSEYVRYRYFSMAEMLVTGLMLLFAGFAFYLCA